MNDRKLYHVTGWFGLVTVVLWLSQFPLYMQGDPSVSVYDGAALGQDLFRIHNVVFTRILLDLGAYVTVMVFVAGFSHLIPRARPEYDWAGTLAFGAMAVWIGVTLVANGLEGAAALDTLGGRADPSAVNAGGWGPVVIANFPPAIWFLVASIALIRKREAIVSAPGRAQPVIPPAADIAASPR